jgi:beta-lactamase class A
MKPRVLITIILAFAALAAVAAAAVLASRQVTGYLAARAILATGSTMAGIPVGGLTPGDAGTRVIQAFTQTPVELRLNGSTILLDPTQAGLNIPVGAMVEQAAAQNGGEYWAGFWQYLWNKTPGPVTIPLTCSADADRLRAFLADQVAPRYTRPPTAGTIIAGTANLQPGQPGSLLDIDPAIPEIQAALCSLDQRVVELHETASTALPPSADQLAPALQALVQVYGFDGLSEIYYQDLKTGREIQLALRGRDKVEPGIAFTAASTIKIPVLVSAFRKIDGDLPDDIRGKMARMIDLSDNASTDAVMMDVLDPNIAPVQVTQDMQALGLKDTFLAGFFYPGAPLLDRYQTPANGRTDLSTDPDMYNQTTAADMGRLLAMIYHCAADGSGPLVETFKGQVTQAECQVLVDFLAKNRKGVLIEAGLPDGSRLAHKYGWVTDPVDGLMHNASDAAIVYSPGGDFILTVYLYHPDQLQWDLAQRLAASFAELIYNFTQAGIPK